MDEEGCNAAQRSPIFSGVQNADAWFDGAEGETLGDGAYEKEEVIRTGIACEGTPEEERRKRR